MQHTRRPFTLPRFTLIGATTRSGLLSSPMLTRFGIRERLDYYSAEQIQKIVLRAGRLLKVPVEEAGAMEVARRSRGTPRIAGNLLRRVRDFADLLTGGVVTGELAQRALEAPRVQLLERVGSGALHARRARGRGIKKVVHVGTPRPPRASARRA
jgi:Holliday junction resolvasome RuvABC ATP-dependent DNA helicase subunit